MVLVEDRCRGRKGSSDAAALCEMNVSIFVQEVQDELDDGIIMSVVWGPTDRLPCSC